VLNREKMKKKVVLLVQLHKTTYLGTTLSNMPLGSKVDGRNL